MSGDFVWQHLADTLHEQLVNGKWPLWGAEDKRFLTLALAGEVGELANEVKKEWRGDGDKMNEIREEVADIRIYLYLLCKCYGINLTDACYEKMLKNSLKFAQVLIDNGALKETIHPVGD